MPNLKDLKNRIKGVKSTQKVTKAMKMVAASKLRRAKSQLDVAKEYYHISETLLNAFNNSDPNKIRNLEEVKGFDSNKELIVVISSERGLCGFFNGSIIKAINAKLSALEKEGKDYRLMVIGKKANLSLRKNHSDKIITYDSGIDGKIINYELAINIANKILSFYKRDKFSSVTIIYNMFINVMNIKPKELRILPIDFSKAEKIDKYFEVELYDGIEHKIVHQYVVNSIYHILAENYAGEHASRMSAMENATKNAGEMISKLTLVYNRTRQAAITKELIEIISGAEAL